jgi:phage terminase large subunit-like protein
MASQKNYVAIAKRYAEGVVSGKITACHWVQRACRRQLDDLKRPISAKWPYRFDAKKANRVCAFAELLPHIKGEWARRGEKIRLEPWQCFIYSTIFGWVHRDTGLRRFRTAYNEVARKNGKSSLSAPLGIYMTVADGEPGAEVYSAATTRDQAKISWEAAKHMVDRSPLLRQTFAVETSAHAIHQNASASRFQALSAEGNTLDGLNTHCAIIDELHAHRTRAVFDVLETSKGARSQPLMWIITTAGSDRSGICYEQRTYVTKVLDGIVNDPSYFGIIYTLDDEDDWKDEANWVKANPNLGVSVDPEELRRLALKAASMPSALNNFLTKHLDVWCNAEVQLFDVAKWDALGDESLNPDEFTEPCFVAIDLAPRHDFCSKLMLFKREEEYYCFARHYLSEDEIEQSENSQYAGWAADGWIKTNPGNVTDYSAIEDDLREDSQMHEVTEVLFDPFSAHQFATRMIEEGFPMIEVRATVQNFSEATKKLDALIAEGKIHHCGDPVLAWMLSNVVGHYDAKSNVFPRKERPENKIDGAIALIMAINRAMVGDAKETFLPSYATVTM